MQADDKAEIGRPLANFHPDLWGDRFLDYTPPDEDTQKQMEQEINELKEEVRKELLTDIKNGKERLLLIDAVQRLGVAYYFETEIEAILQKFHNNYDGGCADKDDLQYASLLFRLLRQQGFYVSCDVFDKFKDKNGSFKESLTDELQGILSLYEASHLRLRGENVLDEALNFTKTHLSSLVSTLSSPSKEQITHALKRPIYKSSTRLEVKHYISIYELDASHNEALLRLAKLDFNMLQQLHKKELSDIIRWSKNLDFTGKFPFTRNRIVEGHCWILGVLYEAKYSRARMIFNKIVKISTVLDDIYDAYGTMGELELFTEAILRWNNSCLYRLPDYMKLMYQIMLDTFQEFEQDSANKGRSYAVYFLQEEVKATCEAYLQEAKWCHEKYIPTYEEYIKVALVSITYAYMLATIYLGMGEIATKDAIEWILRNSKAIKASCVLSRILNDMAGHKFAQKRKHVASAVECYMEHVGVPEEEAYEELEHIVEEQWMDITAEMLRPNAVPMVMLKQILNLSRSAYDIFQTGADGYSMGEYMKAYIEELLIKPAI